MDRTKIQLSIESLPSLDHDEGRRSLVVEDVSDFDSSPPIVAGSTSSPSLVPGSVNGSTRMRRGSSSEFPSVFGGSLSARSGDNGLRLRRAEVSGIRVAEAARLHSWTGPIPPRKKRRRGSKRMLRSMSMSAAALRALKAEMEANEASALSQNGVSVTSSADDMRTSAVASPTPSSVPGTGSSMEEARAMRLVEAVDAIALRAETLGLDLRASDTAVLTTPSVVVIEWESIVDSGLSSVSSVMLGDGRDVGIDHGLVSELELGSGESRSWKRLRTAIVAATDVRLEDATCDTSSEGAPSPPTNMSDTFDTDSMGNASNFSSLAQPVQPRQGTELRCTGRKRDLFLLRALRPQDVVDTFANFIIKDRFGWEGHAVRFHLVHEPAYGSWMCIAHGSLAEIRRRAPNQFVLDGAARKDPTQDDARVRWDALIDAAREETRAGKLVIAYAMLDLGQRSKMPSVVRSHMRVSTSFTFLGTVSVAERVSDSTMVAVDTLRSLCVSAVFTSNDLDEATMEGIAASVFDLPTTRDVIDEADTRLGERIGLVRSADELARTIDENLSEYLDICRMGLIFSPTNGSALTSLIDSFAFLEEDVVAIGSPEFLDECQTADFLVLGSNVQLSRDGIDGLPYNEDALEARAALFRFVDDDDRSDFEDLPTFVRAGPSGEMDDAASGDVDATFEPTVSPNAVVLDKAHPLRSLVNVLELRIRSRFESAQVQFEQECSPAGRIFWLMMAFWFVPIIMLCIWLMVPLTFDSNSQTQSYWAFVLSHTLYQIETAVFGILLFGVSLPLPSSGVQLLAYAVIAGGNVAILHLIWSVEGELTAITTGSSTFPLAAVFLTVITGNMILVSRRCRSATVRGAAQELASRSFTYLYILRSKIRTKHRREWFLGVRMPYFLLDVALYCVLSAVVLICYAYCQAFSTFFKGVTSETAKIVFAFLFSLPLAFLSFVMKHIAIRIEERHLSLVRQGFPVILTICIGEIFVQVFYKGLFTEVTEASTFAVLQVLNATQQFILYPMRMSRTFYTARKRAMQMVGWGRRPYSSALRQQGGVRTSLAAYRHDLATEFCMVSMAQRIAAVGLLVSLSLVRVSPNKEFYRLGQLSDDEASQLIRFTAIMAAIEWGISTIIHIIIRFWHQLDALEVGGTAVDSSRCILPIIIIASHILKDYMLAVNQLSSIVR